MKVLLSSVPIAGHLNPVLAIGGMLKDAGHEVAFMTPSCWRKNIEGAGLRFFPVVAADDRDWTDVAALFPERLTKAPGLERLRWEMENAFIRPMVTQYEGLLTALKDFPADVILADSLFAALLPMQLGAHPARPAVIGLTITVNVWHRDDGAPFGVGVPPAVTAEQRAQYAEMATGIDAALQIPLREIADSILASMGARPLPAFWLDSTLMLPDLLLQPAVPSFEYPRRDLPETVRFIGVLPLPASHALTPELEAAIASGKKLVLVTQGTAANHDLGELLQPSLAALADRDDLIVLVTTGGREISAIPGELPRNAIAAPFLPFDKLLPLTSVLITNCGYGTVTAALAAGVPIVAAGMTEDKPEISTRIEWCGAGINLRTTQPTPEQVREAVDMLLNNPAYKERARQMAKDFAGYDAATLIPQLVEEVASARKGAGAR